MPFQRLVMLIFFLQPIAFGSWLPRIPDVQAKLGMGPADLALVLLGLPVGTLMTFAGSMTTLFFALMLLGVTLSTLELGLNVEADRAEKTTGLVIMSRCHGFWSLGIMVGSLLGVGAAALHMPANWSIALTALILLLPSLLVSVRLPLGADPVAEASQAPGVPFKLPSAALLGICAFTFGITMTEGAIADWSAVYLRDVLLATGALTGLGYSVFACLVATGRFGGDYMKSRFGAVAIARACGCASLAGMLIVLFAPTTTVALVGFAAIGVGVSVGFPLAVTASAGLTDRPAASSVAILTFIALSGFLVGPPAIGFVAEAFGLRVGLGILLVPLAISLLFTRMLIPTREQDESDITADKAA